MNDAAAGYLSDLRATLDSIVERQAEEVDLTATLFADAIGAGGTIHVHDTGHMIAHELVARTGGFVAFARLEFGAHVSRGGLGRPEPPVPVDPAEAASALVSWVLSQNTLRPGDVLLISSVSGVSAPVVELARRVRDHGVPVVALTSRAFSSRLTPRHASGQRLLDAADVVLDNLAPYGDATQHLAGAREPVCPLSGVAGAALMWAIVAQTTARMIERGITPSIYPSINLPDGPERVAAVEARYRAVGQ